MNLEKLVGTKQKVYYPWFQKSIERVIRKDRQGLYILFNGEKVRLEPMYNGMGTDIIGFQAIHNKK